MYHQFRERADVHYARTDEGVTATKGWVAQGGSRNCARNVHGLFAAGELMLACMAQIVWRTRFPTWFSGGAGISAAVHAKQSSRNQRCQESGKLREKCLEPLSAQRRSLMISIDLQEDMQNYVGIFAMR